MGRPAKSDDERLSEQYNCSLSLAEGRAIETLRKASELVRGHAVSASQVIRELILDSARMKRAMDDQ